jgi:hypothetical protein
MNYIYPYLEPVLNLWDDLTHDKKFKELTEVPGDWHSKWLANQRYRVNDQYKEQVRKFNEDPNLADFLWDNKYRFTLLAFVERLYNLRQAQGFLKTRFQVADSNIGALNAIRGQGLLGSFRGNLLNLFHVVGVHYHALLYANNDPTRYIMFSTLFELALYPLDTVRTLYYADVNRQFKSVFDCVAQTVEKRGFGQFYQGVPFKLVYNALFATNLMAYANDSNLVYATFPLWVLSYGFLTLKTRLQIAGSPLSYQKGDAEALFNSIIRRESIRGLYSGLIPFLALNIGAAYCLPSLFSKEKQREILGAIRKQAPPEPRGSKYL